MWLLFGFVGGIGMGLVYLPSLVMIGYYFEEKRAVAMGNANDYFQRDLDTFCSFNLGIATAGSGIGSITFGPLSRFLFDRLGWKGGLGVFSGILLICSICSALMRPIQPTKRRRTAKNSEL